MSLTRSARLLNSEPSPVQDDDDDPDRARQLLQDAANFIPAQHHRHPDRQARPRHRVEPAEFDAEHVLVQKQQGAERLILRGGTQAALDREPGQKRRHFRGAHLGRVRLSMEHDVAANPVDIRLLGPAAVVPRSDDVPHPIQELELGASATVWRRDDLWCLLRVGRG